jgi:hypothetical protein
MRVGLDGKNTGQAILAERLMTSSAPSTLQSAAPM